MTDHTQARRWGAEQRLEFIEFRLFWEGRLKRGDIIKFFGVSVPQASTDISNYKAVASENINYDATEKRFVASDKLTPKFYQPNADRYLAQLRAIDEGIISTDDTWISTPPVVDALPVPHRRVDPDILRNLLQVIRLKQSVEIYHQSLSSRDSKLTWHRITPHALGNDGLRWHVRGYCHEEKHFKDFIISRCQGLRSVEPAGIDCAQDSDWHTFVEVELIPNPDLTQSQRETIAFDYEMADGKVVVPVRLAMLYYFEKRLRLDIKANPERPKDKPVIVANWEELERKRPKLW